MILFFSTLPSVIYFYYFNNFVKRLVMYRYFSFFAFFSQHEYLIVITAVKRQKYKGRATTVTRPYEKVQLHQ